MFQVSKFLAVDSTWFDYNMGDKKRKKASKNTDTNDESLQDSDRQIADKGDIPLVFVNGEAALNPSPLGRKRSRAISSVSMTSDDESGEGQKVDRLFNIFKTWAAARVLSLVKTHRASCSNFSEIFK